MQKTFENNSGEGQEEVKQLNIFPQSLSITVLFLRIKINPHVLLWTIADSILFNGCYIFRNLLSAG